MSYLCNIIIRTFMKAFILAAGLGTRLRPLTDNKPKALVEVNGKTLLDHAVDVVKKAGATSITINVHHFSDLMKEYVANRNYGVPTYISDESDLLLDTGGALNHAAEFLNGDEPVLVHNVDIMSTINLNEALESHRCSGAIATLICNTRNSSRHLLAIDGNLNAWENTTNGARKPDFTDQERANMQPFSFSGIHILSPNIFPYLKEYSDKFGAKFSVIDFYLDLCRKEKVSIYQTEGVVFDCGKIETIAQAEQVFK